MKTFSTPFPKLGKINNKITKKSLGKVAKPLVYAFAIIGFVSVFLIMNLFGLLNRGVSISIPVIPQNAILTVDFNNSFSETYSDSLWGNVDDSQMTYFDLIKYLNTAMLDDNVKALIAKVNVTKLGLAQIHNLQKVLQEFSKHGKKTYIYSSGMGTLGQGTDEYFLASVFDKIYMQPHSDLGITGLDIEIPFIHDGLSKLGLEAEFYTRYEYKNAVASLTENGFSPQYKKQIEGIGAKIFNTLVEGIASNRNLQVAKVKELINRAPLSAEEALEHKLIDKVAYYSDLVAEVKEEVKGKTIKLKDYVANLAPQKKNVPTIAYLAMEGTIVEGGSLDNVLGGEKFIAADTVLSQIKSIGKNKNVKALIVRINSPGGSYTAANSIWYALQELKKKHNIPVIISMGDYAASGGYFIALSGDEIIAEESTLTGSIGVLGGKIVTADLWKKLDVNWGHVRFGDNAGIISPNHKFTAGEKAAFNRSLDNIYADFTQKVIEARHIEVDEVDKVARGRVWLGKDAYEVGLVDKVGNLDDALVSAKLKAGIGPNEKFNIIAYPKAKTLAEKINDLFNQTPQIVINRLESKMGLDITSFNMIKHMQYDCILLPFLINM